jgi:hypothetical protein
MWTPGPVWTEQRIEKSLSSVKNRSPFSQSALQGCFNKCFTTLNAYIIVFRGMYSDSNCHNLAKYAEFCQRWLRLNAAFAGNVGVSKKGFTMVLSVNLFVKFRHAATFEIPL